MSVCSRIVIVKKKSIRKTKVEVGGIVEKKIWRLSGWTRMKRTKTIVPATFARTNIASPT